MDLVEVAVGNLVLQDEFEHRDYQEALINMAKEANIIACLPTGSGKTFIAIKLCQHFKNEVKRNGKKIVFVAPTIPLLKQQCSVLQKHTSFQCNAFSGGTEKFNMESEKSFRSKYAECEIILTTPQYLMNLMVRQYMSFNELALIIFDECHHALNGNPMNQVMKIYREVKEDDPSYPLPRVLGLSATIVRKNVTVDKLALEIADIEKRLDCLAVTYQDMEDVKLHSTNANQHYVSFSNSQLEISGYSEEKFLFPLRNAIKFFESVPVKLKYDSTHQKQHPVKPNRLIFNGKSFVDSLINTLDECCKLTPDLGPYAVLHIAALKIRVLETNCQTVDAVKDSMKLDFIKLAITALKHFMIQAGSSIPSAFKSEPIQHLLSDKITKTLEILTSYKDKVGSRNELCGLIFVERRTTAHALNEILIHLKSSSAEYDFISSEVVIGSNNRAASGPEDRVSFTKQAEVVQGFRDKLYNLLICTSVLEEGIDVPSCNLVIRFDPVFNSASFQQSMGRARQQGANYYILTSEETYKLNYHRIREFILSYDTSIAILGDQANKLQNGEVSSIDNNEDGDDKDYDHIPDFLPNGLYAAKVTAHTCVSLVCGYAAIVNLSNAVVKCWDWYEKFEEIEDFNSGNKVFRATITLPEGSAVADLIITGDIMPNKQLAKRSAFMRAAKKIYEGGGFDRNFMPVLL